LKPVLFDIEGRWNDWSNKERGGVIKASKFIRFLRNRLFLVGVSDFLRKGRDKN